MRGNGSEIRGKAKGMSDSAMAIYMKESILKAKSMGKDGTNGYLASIMMDSGCKAIKKDMVFGMDLRAILTLVNGSKISLTDSVSIFGAMEMLMRVNGKLV